MSSDSALPWPGFPQNFRPSFQRMLESILILLFCFDTEKEQSQHGFQLALE